MTRDPAATGPKVDPIVEHETPPRARRRRADGGRAFGGILVLPVLAGAVWLVLGGSFGPGASANGSDSTRANGNGPATQDQSASIGLGASSVPASPAPGASATPLPVSSLPTLAVTGNVANGEALYLQSCAACHGLQGAGTASAPSIANAGPALTDFVLRTGRMPLAAPTDPSRRKDPAFGDQQIQDLVAYVASLGQGPQIPDVTISGADIAQGRSLFIQNCASCHGAGGAGGAVGGNVVAPPLTQADPRTVGEAVTTGPGPMPVFSFSPQQLDSLAAYVESLRNEPSPGGLAVAEIGPVAEGFLAGTIGVVTLLAVARWIASGGADEDEDDETKETGTKPPGSGGSPSGANEAEA